jgi:hypothetical protein
MRQRYGRDPDEGSPFLEYLLLVVLIIAAAIAAMTFLGRSEDNRLNNMAAPTQHPAQARVAIPVTHGNHAPSLLGDERIA